MKIQCVHWGSLKSPSPKNKQTNKFWMFALHIMWPYIGTFDILFSLVIFFKFRCIGCPLPWNPFEPHMSLTEAIGHLCLPMWLHFGHVWPQMVVFGALCPFLASIGTTNGPLCTFWDQQGPNWDWMGPLLSYRGHQLVHRGHGGLKWVPG